ncbi:AcrR family transcriptional regulator [Marmoricola sp. URHA0025 HA25]
MTGPTLTDAPRTRERILDAALRLFADKGYEATSMREISEQLGITKAALYYHFDSKADIVRAMLADTERQVTGLVDWAREQPATPDLPREVLNRWSDIMQARGLAAFRFVVANRQVIEDLMPAHGGMQHCLGELHEVLAPPGTSVEDQLRTRLALMSINLAAVAGADIDADEPEILAAARRVALTLLPDR